MKVALIGQFQGLKDEGMKNTNTHLRSELMKRAEILILDPSEFYFTKGFRKLRSFCPDIVHYLQGPTIRSLILCRVIRAIFPKTKVVLLASNPAISGKWDFLFPLLKPNYAFSMTRTFHKRLLSHHIPTEIVYPGVNMSNFCPVDRETKLVLRKGFGLPIEKRIILHVGHFTEARGVLLLGNLQGLLKQDVQIVMAGSTTNAPEKAIVEQLQDKGVKIIPGFIPNIETLYQTSDLYIFPGQRTDAAIDIPLSVLEAMAVNLPVVTTPFGGLPDLFSTAPWFRYATSSEEMREAIVEVLARSDIRPATREMIALYTWDGFAENIYNTYCKLTASEYSL